MSLNDFEIGKVLGKGAFGKVAIVMRKKDKKVYAMKCVVLGKVDKSEQESALNEIRILASLNHPNIIGYKEAFYHEPTKTLNIIMELADDGDIAHKVQENNKKHLRFDEETIWEWIIQLLNALKYLHDNKIFHRDLKPANIFLMKSGIVKIGDLNVSIIAKKSFATTKTGTPYYLAPEVWEDKPYDYKCDIWSLGCIIYELCALMPPFRGTSLRGLYLNIKNGYYPDIPSHFSSELKQLIKRILVVDPKKRASTEDLINSSIIQNKIKISKFTIVKKEIKAPSKHVNFIKTIKLPRCLKDINKALPKTKYDAEEEMLRYDGYETLKRKTILELQKQEERKNNPVIEYNKRENNLINMNLPKINDIIPEEKEDIEQNQNKINIISSEEEKKKFNEIKKEFKNPNPNQNPYAGGGRGNIKGNNHQFNVKVVKNPNQPKNNKDKNNIVNKPNNRQNNFRNQGGIINYRQVVQAANRYGFVCKRPQNKAEYGRINYNDYCKNKNIDRNRNYHFRRENGYYNYNNKIKAFKLYQQQQENPFKIGRGINKNQKY